MGELADLPMLPEAPTIATLRMAGVLDMLAVARLLLVLQEEMLIRQVFGGIRLWVRHDVKQDKAHYLYTSAKLPRANLLTTSPNGHL